MEKKEIQNIQELLEKYKKKVTIKIKPNQKEREIYKKIENIEEFVLYNLFIKPTLQKKIVVVLIEGKTGTGKSYTGIFLQEKLEQLFKKLFPKKGVEKFDVEKQVVYTPKEYEEKLNSWSRAPYLTLMVDELRFLVPKQQWHSLMSQSISDANATIRSVKYESVKHGGIIIYNTQTIGDITKDIRKTIDYDIILERKGRKVVGKIYDFFVERYNIETPKVKQKVVGFKKNNLNFKIKSMIFKLPSKETRKKFDDLSFNAKKDILEFKLKKVLGEIRKHFKGMRNYEEELKDDEVFESVKFLAKWKGNKITFSSQNKKLLFKIFDLNNSDFKNKFLPALYNEAKERGLL